MKGTSSANVRRPGCRIAAGFLALCGFACAATPTSADRSAPPEPAAETIMVLDEPPDLSALFEPSRIGGGAGLRSVAVGAAAPGDRIGARLAIPAHDCVRLLGRASPSVSDLDLFAYSDDGAVLGTNEERDPRPELLVCPPHSQELYVSARVVAGHGLVAIGAQLIPAAQAHAVRRQLGLPDEAAPPAELEDPRWPNLAARLAEHRDALGGEWTVTSRQVLPTDSRVATHVSATVRGHRCVDALLMPDRRVGHLDVAIHDLEGRLLGRALASGRERFAIVCAPNDGGFTLSVRPQSGRGTTALVLSTSVNEGETALDVANVRLDLAPVGDLDHQRQRLLTELLARGYEKTPSWTRVMTTKRRRVSIPLDLAPGCHRLDVLAGRPSRGATASLWSTEGELLGTSTRRAPAALLIACTESVRARLELQLESPGAPIALELRDVRGASPVLRDLPLAANRLLTRMVGRGVIRSIAQVTKVERFELSASRLRQVPLALPVARCVDVTVALADVAERGVELRLRDRNSGEELAFARGADSAAVRACSLERRPEAVELIAETRTLSGNGTVLFAYRLLAPKP